MALACRTFLLTLLTSIAAHTGAHAAAADLVGPWTTVKADATGQYEARMVLEEGGSAHLAGSITYSEGYLDTLDTTAIEGFSLFADGLVVSFVSEGGWRADDDSLHIDAGVAVLLLNGLEPVEFVTDAGRRLANVLADALGLPKEGREGFEANTVAALLLQMDPDFLTAEATQSFELGKAYTLDKNLLTLRDAEGTSRWEREGVGSAVEAVTWGRVKGGVQGLGFGVW